MTEQTVYVVFSEGPHGESYPYGVFTTEESAQEAREAIIKKLDDQLGDTLDGEHVELAHELAGTLDETTQIEECVLRSEFRDGDLDDLFEDV